MKKTLIISALLAGSLSAYSQGTITWNDATATAFEIHIYSPNVANPAAEIQGTSAIDKPTAGGTSFTGAQLLGQGNTSTVAGFTYATGANFTVQLYAAPGTGVALSSLSPVTQYVSTIYTTTSTASAGLFKPLNLGSSDTGIPNSLSPSGAGVGNYTSGAATIAIAAWYNPGGDTYATENAAYNAGAPAGFSLTANDTSLGGVGSPPGTASALPESLGSFSLAVVPEPSTIALGVIGASTFLFRRRK